MAEQFLGGIFSHLWRLKVSGKITALESPRQNRMVHRSAVENHRGRHLGWLSSYQCHPKEMTLRSPSRESRLLLQLYGVPVSLDQLMALLFLRALLLPLLPQFAETSLSTPDRRRPPTNKVWRSGKISYRNDSTKCAGYTSQPGSLLNSRTEAKGSSHLVERRGISCKTSDTHVPFHRRLSFFLEVERAFLCAFSASIFDGLRARMADVAGDAIAPWLQ